MALAGATGVSMGAAWTLPNLFFGSECNEPEVKNKFTYAGKESVLGDDCFVLVSNEPNMQTTWWISKKTWVLKAGQTLAQYRLADLYVRGLGVKRDEKIAFNLFKQAAQSGHVKAQYELGTAYLDGRGIKRDAKLGAQWLTEAADSGDAKAQDSFNVLY